MKIPIGSILIGCPKCYEENEVTILEGKTVENKCKACGTGLPTDFYEVEIRCPHCRKKTKALIPENSQIWDIHCADSVCENLCKINDKCPQNIEKCPHRMVKLDFIGNWGNEGEIEFRCQNKDCNKTIHVWRKPGMEFAKYKHFLEIFIDSVKNLSKSPRHVFDFLPDDYYRRSLSVIFSLCFFFALAFVPFLLNIYTGYGDYNLKFHGQIFFASIYSFLVFTIYFLLKRIKEIIIEFENHIVEEDKFKVYKSFSFVYSWRAFLLFFVIISSWQSTILILKFDNFNNF